MKPGGIHRTTPCSCPAARWGAAALSLWLAAGAARAQEVVVVRATDLAPHRAVETAFVVHFGRPVRTVLLAPGDLEAQLRVVDKAALVFAIGPEVARAAAALHGPRVLHALVPDPEAAGLDYRTPGIPAWTSPATALKALEALVPTARRVGILTDPSCSDEYVARCLMASRGSAVELRVRQVRKRADVPAALSALIPQVDAIWLVPDATVCAGENVRVLLDTTRRMGVPTVGCTEAMVKDGLPLGVEPDWTDVGRRAALAARQLLSNGRPDLGPPDGALFLNARTAAEQHLRLTPALREAARKVFE